MSTERPNSARPVAFEPAYRAHFAFVWRALKRLGVPERDLPDAAHDVFLVVHARLAEFDFRHRLTTWIYAICLRIASDRRRKAATRYEVLDDPCEPAAAVDPELAERRALLGRCLDAMPLEQRAAFTLFELEGLTGEEVAALLDIPAATAHSRLRLARETFRRALKREEAREHFALARLGENR
jgi:RNA polymerase sigma-70 factor (ECF subfamily)